MSCSSTSNDSEDALGTIGMSHRLYLDFVPYDFRNLMFEVTDGTRVLSRLAAVHFGFESDYWNLLNMSRSVKIAIGW